MKFKKSLLNILIMIIAIIIASGCAKEEPGESKGKSENNEGLKELTYFVDMNPNAAPVMKDYNGIAAYQKLEEITGVKVKFEHPPSGDEGTQQFNLMMASAELPDVIEVSWSSVPGGPTAYLESGHIIRLNDYIEKYAPNLNRALEENPEWKKQISTDDGSIYGFPSLRGSEGSLSFYGPIIRKDWLEKLDLDVPTTIDEWYTVLRAFKNDDPNGNGEEDEIPLLPDVNSNMFVNAWGITSGFYQVDNQVRYGPIQPEFKEYLTVMNKWFEEGLIDPTYVVSDADLKDANITQHKLGAFMGYAGADIGKYIDLMEDDPDFKIVGTPYPTLNKGDTPIVSQKAPNYEGIAAAITKNNEYIEETMEWLDYGFSEEGYMLFNWGIEGESYEIIDGKPVYTDLITDNPDGLSMGQALAQYARSPWNGPFVKDPEYQRQYFKHNEQTEATETWAEAKNEILMPLTSETAEESEELSELLTDIDTYKETMVAKFINGDEPLSKFDEYVETLKQMGIDRVIEIRQDALDRYNKR